MDDDGKTYNDKDDYLEAERRIAEEKERQLDQSIKDQEDIARGLGLNLSGLPPGMSKEDKLAYLIKLIKICEELASDNIDVNEAQKRADDLIPGKSIDEDNNKSLWDKILYVINHPLFSRIASLLSDIAIFAFGFIPFIGPMLDIVQGIYEITSNVAFALIGIVSGIIGLAFDIGGLITGGTSIIVNKIMKMALEIPTLKKVITYGTVVISLWDEYVSLLKLLGNGMGYISKIKDGLIFIIEAVNIFFNNEKVEF